MKHITPDGLSALVLVSDLHSGSDVGLLAPGVKIGKGNVVDIGDNVCQQFLWKNWNLLQKKAIAILDGQPFALVVNGDATEGIHHRSEEVVAASIEDHTEIAAACLKDFCHKADKVFVTKGTECHTKGMEDVLAMKINGVSGKAQDKWLIQIKDCLIEAQHHMPCTARAYLEAGAMSAILGNSRLNCVRSGHRPPDILLRAHRHCGGVYEDGHGMVCVTGAWQFLTRHGKKVVTDSIPRPSIIVLVWNGNKLPQVHHLTCNAPQEEIHVL